MAFQPYIPEKPKIQPTQLEVRQMARFEAGTHVVLESRSNGVAYARDLDTEELYSFPTDSHRIQPTKKEDAQIAMLAAHGKNVILMSRSGAVAYLEDLDTGERYHIPTDYQRSSQPTHADIEIEPTEAEREVMAYFAGLGVYVYLESREAGEGAITMAHFRDIYGRAIVVPSDPWRYYRPGNHEFRRHE